MLDTLRGEGEARVATGRERRDRPDILGFRYPLDFFTQFSQGVRSHDQDGPKKSF